MRRIRAHLVLGVLAAFLVVACKAKPPKPGSPCKKEGAATCVDKTSRVVCKNGKNILEKCVSCEQTKSSGIGSSSETSFFAGCIAGGIGPEGAPCEGETFDCDGPNTYVKCVAGKYHRIPCGGARGCRHETDGVTCDATIGAAGDACRERSVACTNDKHGLLHCQNGVYVLDKSCGGPKGCIAEPDKTPGSYTLKCDSSLGVVGGPCIDGGTCSADKLSILKCDNGKYVPYKRCRGTVAECRLEGDTFRCAESGIGEVGDACDGGGACASDGKALLECKNGVLAVRNRCRTCKIKGDQADCRF